jgi:hypothetical protein
MMILTYDTIASVLPGVKFNFRSTLPFCIVLSFVQKTSVLIVMKDRSLCASAL